MWHLYSHFIDQHLNPSAEKGAIAGQEQEKKPLVEPTGPGIGLGVSSGTGLGGPLTEPELLSDR